MASDLYSSFGVSENSSVVNAKNATTTPQEQCKEIMKQRGINVPDSIANNPQAIIQHLMQSGAVPQQRLQMAQQVMQRMFRR